MRRGGPGRLARHHAGRLRRARAPVHCNPRKMACSRRREIPRPSQHRPGRGCETSLPPTSVRRAGTSGRTCRERSSRLPYRPMPSLRSTSCQHVFRGDRVVCTDMPVSRTPGLGVSADMSSHSPECISGKGGHRLASRASPAWPWSSRRGRGRTSTVCSHIHGCARWCLSGPCRCDTWTDDVAERVGIDVFAIVGKG